jgi:hypothetical protein
VLGADSLLEIERLWRRESCEGVQLLGLVFRPGIPVAARS